MGIKARIVAALLLLAGIPVFEVLATPSDVVTVILQDDDPDDDDTPACDDDCIRAFTPWLQQRDI